MSLQIRIIILLSLSIVLRWGLFAQPVRIDGVLRDTSYTVYSSYVKERKKFPFIRPVEVRTDDLKVYSGVPYKILSADRHLVLHIYRPLGTEQLPAVLMIHGGGWSSGSPDLQRALAASLARKGFVTLAAEYRLTPEAPYPAGVEDLADAVRWIAGNAATYGINKDKIAVSGCSAGGHLANLIGMANTDGLIKAVVNMDGITSFVVAATVERAQQARNAGGKMPVDAQWLGGTYREQPANWQNASPLYLVGEKSSPICFINSSIARFHSGRDEQIRRLDSLGIYSEVHTFADSPHTFWHFHPWHLPTVEHASRFLDKIFHGK